MLRAVSLALAAACCTADRSADTPEDRIVDTFKDRSDFLWGTATAAYQVEGAWNRDGKQPSIWDVWSHKPGNILNNDTADVADGFYDHYLEDIARISNYSFNSFRMSISWPRVFPTGPDGVRRPNPKGIEFYKNVTQGLRAQGITPLVTLYHWDLPEDLDWLDETVADEFAAYAELMFKTFPEVKHWLTFNEPLSFCPSGYGSGSGAPGKKGQQYVCGHNVLRAHAKAVAIYRQKYQQSSGGKIGITLSYQWVFPYNSSSDADKAAVQLHHDFGVGWWADPIFLTGDYPESMRKHLGDTLPKFTQEEQQALKGSSDYYGLNCYTASYAKAPADPAQLYELTHVGIDGKLIGPKAASDWLYVVPTSIRGYLEYVTQRYKPSSIIVTENGVDVPGENTMPLQEALNDNFRVDYYRAYLDAVAAAVREANVPLDGYFAWSLMDNFEWASGYSCRFGLTYVDYSTLERYTKSSAVWFKELLGRMRAAVPLLQV